MINVLMSVYNGEKYVKESLKSILSQTLTDFELDIIDDASDDDTVKIIKSFNDKRLIFFQNKTSQGLTKNLNFLLEKSKGEYIARQDADDISHPKRLIKELEFLEINNLDLVGCGANLINEDDVVTGERSYRGTNIKNDLIKFNMFPHSSWLAKRQVFTELKGYDENYRFAQDYDFLLRAVNKFKFGILNEKLIDLRWDLKSVSLTHLKAQQKYALFARLSAIKRKDYFMLNYLHLIKPLISYLLPVSFNKYIYQHLIHD